MAAAAAAIGMLPALWPEGNFLRLILLLQVQDVAALAGTCTAAWKRWREFLHLMREGGGDPERFRPLLEAKEALLDCEAALSLCGVTSEPEAAADLVTREEKCASFVQELQVLQKALRSETFFVYSLDWNVKPGMLVSKKGTWLKASAAFSWELPSSKKLYVPQGVVVPALQIGKVKDPGELKRHEWVAHHLRVWLKPIIVDTLSKRRSVWFVYWPHFEDQGRKIVALSDTWLKRSCQMSGELEPFELIYVPRSAPVHLSSPAGPVEEEWEKQRHKHIHLHRRVLLATAPICMKQDKYDILVSQEGFERGRNT